VDHRGAHRRASTEPLDGPIVAKAAFGYLSDDGTIYQLSWEAANETPTAGNLPAASSLSPVFPALWVPRHLIARATILGVPTTARCICQATNTAYLTGPGSTVLIGLISYVVSSCVGEDRQDD